MPIAGEVRWHGTAAPFIATFRAKVWILVRFPATDIRWPALDGWSWGRDKGRGGFLALRLPRKNHPERGQDNNNPYYLKPIRITLGFAGIVHAQSFRRGS